MPEKQRFTASDFTEFEHEDDDAFNLQPLKEHKPTLEHSAEAYADLPTTTVTEGLPTYERQRRKAVRQENFLHIINALDPSVVNCCSSLLKCLMDKLANFKSVKLEKHKTCQPMECFASQQCFLTAFLIHRKLTRKRLSYLHIREYFENLGSLCEEYTMRYGTSYGNCVSCNLRTMMLALEQLAGHLERCSGVQRTDWIDVARMYSSESFSPSVKEDMTAYLNIKLFTPVKIIGGGNFGSTYVATLGPQSDVKICLKLVNIFSVHDSTYLIASKVFAAMVTSPWIRRQYCAFSTSEAHVFASEPFIGVSLYRIVKNCGRFGDEATLRIILAQLAMAIQHMHIQGFLHRNIKPSSLMLNQRGRLIVGDFDKCKICLGRFTNYKLRVFDRGTVGEFSDKTRVGSVSYMAPEMLLSQPYGRSSDWWSFGVTTYAIFVGKIPFSGKGYKVQKTAIIEGKYEFPETMACSDDLKSLINRVLRVKPHERLCSLNYREIWQLRFFKGLDLHSIQTSDELIDLSTINDLECDASMSEASIRFEDLTDSRDEDNMLTFTSPGFVRVIQKIFTEQPYTEQDLVDPIKYLTPETPYVYKYQQKMIEDPEPTSDSQSRGSNKDLTNDSLAQPFLLGPKVDVKNNSTLKALMKAQDVSVSSKVSPVKPRKRTRQAFPRKLSTSAQRSGKYTDRLVRAVRESDTEEPPSLEIGFHLMESQLTAGASPKKARNKPSQSSVKQKKKKKWYNVFFGRPQ